MYHQKSGSVPKCHGSETMISRIFFSRVVDPYSFFTDPDPEFDVGDQYGSRALMTKNFKKITAEHFFFFFIYQKLQFTYPQASIKYVQVIEELAFSTQKRPSTLQNMNFYKFLSTFVGHFCPPGSGSKDPIEYGSNTDPDPVPDPQPCFLEIGTVHYSYYSTGSHLFSGRGIYLFLVLPSFYKYTLSFKAYCIAGSASRLMSVPVLNKPRKIELLKAVLRIHDILVRIRIRGSMPLTTGSGSGSCYFHH